ncbi:MAG: PQQ-binding-like beta-propeller repeat protein [Deltaproteobacteria bacterium]|nr:PQQ-binding-like beta-propeller repeat protein [Myxococcales bacterium]MDP3217203.1 PQQ-binding-like beta-propeller repeat protein [Deltaproteobacteria bacterium]
MKFKRVTFGAGGVESDVAASPLATASLPERFADVPPRSPPEAVLQTWGGPTQDGRVHASLIDPMAFRWGERFAAPLRDGTTATGLLYVEDAVLVQAAIWQLFDLEGTPRRAGLGGPSAITLSPSDMTFRFVNSDGLLVAHSLSDGEPLWSCGAPIGTNGPYGVHALVGTATLLAGNERDVNPEALEFTPEFSAQWIDATSKPEVSRGGLLRNAKRSAALTGPARGDLFGATDGRQVVLAFEDHVLHLDMELAVRRLSTAPFAPRAISLGDAGRAYLVVTTPDGHALWMLNAEGERVFAAPLPAPTKVPPILAADHRVFVTTDAEILAFSPTGELRWRFASPDGAPRASVTADGWLLASTGEELRAFDAEGQSAILARSPGQRFVTAPLLTLSGEILVATTRTLFCLGYERIPRA